MSLESLFQHIIFSEHQAEESRRLMREGQGLCPLSWGLGAGGKAVGSGQGSGGWGKTAERCLTTGTRMGTPETWTCLSI